jgi:hypothetical protein
LARSTTRLRRSSIQQKSSSMQLIGEFSLGPEPGGTLSEVFAGGTDIVRNAHRVELSRALRLKKPKLRMWVVWHAY